LKSLTLKIKLKLYRHVCRLDIKSFVLKDKTDEKLLLVLCFRVLLSTGHVKISQILKLFGLLVKKQSFLPLLKILLKQAGGKRNKTKKIFI